MSPLAGYSWIDKLITYIHGRCATDPGVEGLNPGRVNQVNHVSSMKM